uniref:Transposase n=1 Tax=Meloidogyne hapla TaxID=6305 RepID=A0A1I8BD33_MELHA
ACINYFSANRETFILSNEWNEFKINNKDFAFRLLEEKQIYGKQIGKNQSNAEVPLNNKKRTVGRKGYKPEQVKLKFDLNSQIKTFSIRILNA